MEASVVQARASGRVNLIGEHTDYNGGYMLPTAIPQYTEVTIRRRPSDDQRVTATSRTFEGATEYRLGEEKLRGHWVDYLQGATWLLGCEGKRFPGFDVEIQSTIPVGSGLSSSAALAVAFLRGLRQAYSLDLPDLRLAQLGQRIENDFVGARVGIMDPMAASLSDRQHALFIDARDLSWRRVPLPTSRCELVVISSGIRHHNSAKTTTAAGPDSSGVMTPEGSDYNTRRAECEEACRLLGIAALRELTEGDLETRAFRELPDRLGRRARHIITENVRVLSAVAALERGDLAELGRLFAASHASMRDDYEISLPEIDRLVQVTTAQTGIFGARLTGGGFGGSIVALAEKGAGAIAAERAAAEYTRHTGYKAQVLVPQDG